MTPEELKQLSLEDQTKLLQGLADKIPTIQVQKNGEAGPPREIELDGYEKLYIDSILYRKDAATKSFQLSQIELKACEQMQQQLVNSLVTKHGIDTQNQDMHIDAARKMIIVQDKVT